MKYKGYELLKAIEDGKIKEGSRFKVYRTYNAIAVLEDRTLHFEDGNKRILTTNDLLIYTFELIENKIDIDSIEEDMKILEGIIKGDEDCINAIYSQMKVKNDNDEDIQYFKKEIQSIKNIVNNYLKEKARADKLEKEYSIMLSQLDEREINYKRE